MAGMHAQYGYKFRFQNFSRVLSWFLTGTLKQYNTKKERKKHTKIALSHKQSI